MAIDLGDDPYGTEPSPAEKLQIRTAIGVGTTDSPTFLAQSLTGQSLTGTQATSLVDMAATWNTTGTPSALKLNVTDTASNAASKLMDLQVGGVSKFDVSKAGVVKINNGGTLTWASADSLVFGSTSGYQRVLSYSLYASNLLAGMGDVAGQGGCQLYLGSGSGLGWASGTTIGTGIDTMIFRDGAAGILAQRNGTAKQVHRVYNTFLGTTANEWGGFDWLTTANTLRIGTEHGGTGTARPIDFVVGGVVKMSVTSTSLSFTDTIYPLGNVFVSGYVRVPATQRFEIQGRALITSPSDGVLGLTNGASTSFTRLELGTANLGISRGTGGPEGVVTALVGSLYLRTDGGAATTLYVKESSPTPNTGWVAK
jgi:hypothetical protein